MNSELADALQASEIRVYRRGEEPAQATFAGVAGLALAGADSPLADAGSRLVGATPRARLLDTALVRAELVRLRGPR